MSSYNNSTIYVGVTNDLERRVEEHKSANEETFTGKYNCQKLVYYEKYSSIDEAISREKQIKSWSRKRKNNLINSINKARQDLMNCQMKQ